MGLCLCFIVDIRRFKIPDNNAVIRLFYGHFAKSRTFLALISRNNPEFLRKLENWSRLCGSFLRQRLQLLSVLVTNRKLPCLLLAIPYKPGSE